MSHSHDKARIVALGSYLPERVLSNADLEKMVETTDEWIFSRTGMRERRIAAEGEFPSDMGASAAKEALAAARLAPEEVEMILVATMSPDYISPSTAGLIQAKIGATSAAAMDVQAACSGFLYLLSLAQAYIESGAYKNVLVIATEKMSAFMDYTDRTTCVLFGDGAAAAVIKPKGEGLRIDALCLGSDGALAELVIIPGGGSRFPASEESLLTKKHYFKMSGKEVFKHAVRRMEEAAHQCLKNAHLQHSDISWLVPHQANKRIIDTLAKNFDIPKERVFLTLQKYGNTSASSVAIALHELTKEHPICDGEHLLLIAFGGGVTWGASILTKVGENG